MHFSYHTAGVLILGTSFNVLDQSTITTDNKMYSQRHAGIIQSHALYVLQLVCFISYHISSFETVTVLPIGLYYFNSVKV
jgi:hypothetical protein